MTKFVSILSISLLLLGCQKPVDPLTSIINGNATLKKIATEKKHAVQVIYTQIDRDEYQRPTFTSFTFQLDSNGYFYPASTVKYPVSLLALEMINHLGVEGFNKYARVEIDSAHSRQIPVRTDSTAPDMLPTLAHYIRKVFIVSDNDAYNRLYEFLGQDYINETLRSKKYGQTRILHRLSLARTREENMYGNPMRFYDGDQLVYESPLSKASGAFYPNAVIRRGKAYMDQEGNVVPEPFDFSEKNFFPLQEQHQLLMATFFPDHFPSYAFDLSEDDYRFLYRNMALLPHESGISEYEDKEAYWPAYSKFLMYGSDKNVEIPDHIRIFNKIGLAYGYATDNAYVIDIDNGVEFFLSATILANENETFNDGQYEYDEVALPFLGQLGMVVYAYERNRTRAFKPDLTFLSSLF